MIWSHCFRYAEAEAGNSGWLIVSLPNKASRNRITRPSSIFACCLRAKRAVFGFRRWMYRIGFSSIESRGKTRSCLFSERNSAGCNMPRYPSIETAAHRCQPQRSERANAARMIGAEITGLHSPGSASCHFRSICQAGDKKLLKCGSKSATAVIAYTSKYRGCPCSYKKQPYPRQSKSHAVCIQAQLRKVTLKVLRDP